MGGREGTDRWIVRGFVKSMVERVLYFLLLLLRLLFLKQRRVYLQWGINFNGRNSLSLEAVPFEMAPEKKNDDYRWNWGARLLYGCTSERERGYNVPDICRGKGVELMLRVMAHYS